MRWLIRLVLTLGVFVVLAVGALFLLPADRIAGLAADQIRAATGRELTMTGRLRPAIWPDIGISTGPVALSNADWSDQGPLLQAKGLSVGLDLRALIGGDIVIRQITAEAPQIVLERAADGRVNWALGGEEATGGAAPGDGGGGAPRAFTLDTGRITGARVTYIDHATGQRTDLSGLDATLALPDYAGAATLALSATLNGAPLSADVTIGQVAAMMEGRVSTVAVQAALAGAKAGFEGRAGLRPLAAEGTVQAEATDLPALFAALGQPAPDLPPGVGQRLGVSGQLTYAPEGSVHLREATLRQDDNVLSGAADLFLQEKPRLTGQFRAGALDLSAFTLEEPQANGAAGGDTARGWSTAPIDVGALGALDAELALTADSVNLGKGQLGPTQIRATLTDRRLVIDLQRVQGYGGTVTGAVVVNGRGGLSVRGDLAVAGMQMQPLLGDLAGFERLIGQGDVTLSVLGSGASLAAIMDSLDGTGAVSFGKGEILGLDITGMLRTLDTSYVGKGSKTIFDAITASFTIEDGVLRNDDLSFVAPLLRAVGEGRVGLGGQTVKYRLVPTALSGTDGKGGLKVPLLIRGSWSDPKFQLDLEALAEEELDLEGQREALKEQAEAVAEKAREDLRTRAAEELGVSSDEGESLEDAARRKLREEAEKGLRGLFGIK